MDIVGLGTVAMDVIMQVDSFPKEDGFALVREKKYLDGGSASNVMVQASRLGARCSFMAQVGDDEIGTAIKNGLAKENVDISSMVTLKNGTSLHTTIVVGEGGKKFILLNMGDAFLTMKLESVSKEWIKSGKIFYTDLLPGEPAIYALREAKKAGLKTVFNLQVGIPLMEQFGVKRQDIHDVLRDVDLFAPCRESFAQLTGTEDYFEGIQLFKKYFGGLLLLTLGTEGSIIVDGETIIKVTAYKVDALDTTGAGDSYIGAFMVAYYIQKMELKRSMEFAAIAAALTCKSIGARTSPTQREIDPLIK